MMKNGTAKENKGNKGEQMSTSKKRTKDQLDADYWNAPDAYCVETKNSVFFHNGNWRGLVQKLKAYGYDIPLSACRSLFNGKRFTSFDDVKIEFLNHAFGKA